MTETAVLAPYLRDLRRIRPLTMEEETELRERIRAGDDRARDRLAEGCLALAIALALRHSAHTGHAFLGDFVQESNLVLLVCARRFDPGMPVPFHVLAGSRIKYGLYMAGLRIANTIRLPRRQLEIRQALAAATRELAQRYRRPPTRAELADALGLTESQLVYLLLRLPQRVEPVAERPEDAQEQGHDTAVLVDPRTPETAMVEAQERAEHAATLDRLRDGVAGLPRRERRILVLRYGLDGERVRSLEETGRAIGVGASRVDQLRARSFTTLRATRAGA